MANIIQADLFEDKVILKKSDWEKIRKIIKEKFIIKENEFNLLNYWISLSNWAENNKEIVNEFLKELD